MLTWRDLLQQEKKLFYFQQIISNINKMRDLGIIIYPADIDIFNAFRYTKFEDIKVVILGQDPYCKPNQAHGLAFSVPPGISIPPSLKNIYKELSNDINNFILPTHGCLQNWAQQGIMLLNTILTVESGKTKSHDNLGWEIFTDKVISLINAFHKGIVFLLWGQHAQKKQVLINPDHHYILTASHPSPLSAHLGFFNCHHFSKTNIFLEKEGKKPIIWNL